MSVEVIRAQDDLVQVLITYPGGSQTLYDIWASGEVGRMWRRQSSDIWPPDEDSSLEEVREILGSKARELDALLKAAV